MLVCDIHVVNSSQSGVSDRVGLQTHNCLHHVVSGVMKVSVSDRLRQFRCRGAERKIYRLRALATDAHEIAREKVKGSTQIMHHVADDGGKLRRHWPPDARYPSVEVRRVHIEERRDDHRAWLFCEVGRNLVA